MDRIAQVPAQRKESSRRKIQGSPAEKHFKQKKEKRICTEGHEGHKEMGREHARAKVRSCDVTSAAATRYHEAPSEPRFGFRW